MKAVALLRSWNQIESRIQRNYDDINRQMHGYYDLPEALAVRLARLPWLNHWICDSQPSGSASRDTVGLHTSSILYSSKRHLVQRRKPRFTYHMGH